METELRDIIISALFGYFEYQIIEGRGLCALSRQIYTVGLLYGIDEQENYKGRYCFHSLAEAKEAIREWDGAGDPPGNWIKHKGGDGEYRNPNYEE